MTDSCGVLQVLAEQQDAVFVPFENTPTIERYHNSLPRLSSNKDVLDDSYTLSLIGFGIAYVGFFLIWALVLAFFKWKKIGGWLSGSRIIIATKEGEGVTESSFRDNKNEGNGVETKATASKKQSLALRTVLYLTMTAIITANMTLYFTGLKDLTKAANSGLETLDQAEAQMKLSVCLFEQVIGEVDQVENDTQTLLDQANNICPKVSNQFCSILSDPTTCGNGRRDLLDLNPCAYITTVCDTFSDIYDEVQGVIMRLMQSMQDGIEFLQSEISFKLELEEIRDDINGKIELKLAQLKDQIETTEGMVMFSSVLCWFSTLVCIGLLTAHFLKKPRLIKIFFGLFLLITLLILVAAVANAIAAFVVSDLCVDDPDSRAIELLLLRLDLKSAVLEDMARVFLENMASGNCYKQPPTQFLIDGIEFLQNGMNAFDGWSNFFWGSDRIQQAACGADASSMAKIEEFMDNSINSKLNTTSVLLETGGRLFTCGFWMGLFEKGLHQATCYDGMEALATVSLAQFVILCMCMLVVTCRVALWDILEGNDEGTET